MCVSQLNISAVDWEPEPMVTSSGHQVSRAAGEAECYAKSNEEVNHQAQHKTAVMAKQSQGLLHVAWMTQHGGCPSATDTFTSTMQRNAQRHSCSRIHLQITSRHRTASLLNSATQTRIDERLSHCSEVSTCDAKVSILDSSLTLGYGRHHI
ncbi:hypothetical protein EYF80_046963 [Liparis tanakae]|uniref:Uncharacterized protein n=1 Tax=Liparis tanakae TaxID=230148 RepID=A0A4Z2FPR0_9TELE|nr:hypothetical protein EYF80_046963 [Liparis tanakae]